MSNTKARIAILEDKSKLQEELILCLQSQGHTVWATSEVETFWKQLHFQPVDMAFVNIDIQEECGFSVIYHLKLLGNYDVIAISTHGHLQDKLHALSLGADAHLIKPINFSDLIHTIDALWHRKCSNEATSSPGSSYIPTLWSLNRRLLTAPCGTQISITAQEYALLDILFRHNNAVFSKEHLCSILFGYDTNPDTHRIDVILSRIRTKARKQDVHLPVRAIFGKGIVFINH